MGPDGWQSEDIEPTSDLGARLSAQVPVYLYHGSEDGTAPFEHVGLYERAIPQATVRGTSLFRCKLRLPTCLRLCGERAPEQENEVRLLDRAGRLSHPLILR